MTPEVVASGIGFGEGPVWRPEHRDLVVTSESEGWLFRADVQTVLLDGHFVTNCCFGGPALDTLFVTDAGNGTVLAFEGMPTARHPLQAFALGQVD